MKRTRQTLRGASLAAIAALGTLVPCVTAQTLRGREVTIPVTVHPHGERARELADKLQPGDFAVRENSRRQEILSVKRPAETPLVLAVLIQDDLISRVNTELSTIKEFIRRLPEGSTVMVGYLTVGDLKVAQEFTTDFRRAADSVRVVVGSTSASPFNPYLGVVATVKRFDSQPQGRRAVLMISDGLDTSRGLRNASPNLSVDLDRAIREAQRQAVAVNTFYAPSVGLTSFNRIAISYGQGSLNRLADETGGDAFFTGDTFVSFSPYFSELNELIKRHWLITYRSTNTGRGFRKIDVTTEHDLHVHHPRGYYPAREKL